MSKHSPPMVSHCHVCMHPWRSACGHRPAQCDDGGWRPESRVAVSSSSLDAKDCCWIDARNMLIWAMALRRWRGQGRPDAKTSSSQKSSPSMVEYSACILQQLSSMSLELQNVALNTSETRKLNSIIFRFGHRQTHSRYPPFRFMIFRAASR